MKLTTSQVQDVGEYISKIPKFRETYNELYDHIITSLENSEEEFTLDAIDKIVNADLYGYYEIVHQEKKHQKELHKKYNKLFLLEMLNAFKWPEIINSIGIFGICLIIYFYNDGSSNLKLIVLGSVCSCVVITIYAVFIVFHRRMKFGRYSILDSFLITEGSFGMLISSLLLNSFLSKDNVYNISSNTKLVITLSLFFFTSVFVRAFVKFYNQKIKVLEV